MEKGVDRKAQEAQARNDKQRWQPRRWLPIPREEWDTVNLGNGFLRKLWHRDLRVGLLQDIPAACAVSGAGEYDGVTPRTSAHVLDYRDLLAERVCRLTLS
jgi:hypothetical protein